MGQESFPDRPEPNQVTGTKRLPALCDGDPENKRLCMQLSDLPPVSAALKLSNEYDFWGGSSIVSNPESGNFAQQYGINPETDWSNAVPSGSFGGLFSIV